MQPNRQGRGWVATVLLGTLFSAVAAASPLQVAHSGRLLSGADEPVQGVVRMTFRLYDAASAGTLAWSGTDCDIEVKNGHYAVVLGNPGAGGCGSNLTTDLWPATSARFLEVSLGSTVLLPRQALAPVPAAASAAHALVADSLSAAGMTALDARFAPLDAMGKVPLSVLPVQIPDPARLSVAAAQTFAGPLAAPGFTGDGSGLTHLDASQLTFGTVPDARLGSSVVRLDATGKVPLSVLPVQIPDPARLSVTTTQTFAGSLAAASFTGDGGGLTSINASQVTSGILPDAVIPSNIVRKSTTGTLEVGGPVQLGDDSAGVTSTCSAGGTMKWSSGGLYVCDGAGWRRIRFGSDGSAGSPGKSCKELREQGVATSGKYWIDPDGGSASNAYEVYCDMVTDGGGWTMVLVARGDAGAGLWSRYDTWRNTTTPTSDPANPMAAASQFSRAFVDVAGSDVLGKEDNSGYVLLRNAWSNLTWRQVYTFNYSGWPTLPSYERELAITQKTVASDSVLFGTSWSDPNGYGHWYVFPRDEGGDTYSMLGTQHYAVGTHAMTGEADQGFGANEEGSANGTGWPPTLHSSGSAFDVGGNNAAAFPNYASRVYQLFIR